MLKLETGLLVGAAASRAGVTPSALQVHAHRAYIALKLLSEGPIGREADPCAT
jgi:hypothetical protein